MATSVFAVSANRGPARNGTLTVQGGQTPSRSPRRDGVDRLQQQHAAGFPDNATMDSNLTVSGLTQPIANISVSLYLTHTFDADLVINLVGPDGTIVTLSSLRGGSGDNYGSACSPRHFAQPIRRQLADARSRVQRRRSSGSFRPEQPLSRFLGKSGTAANGTWKLRIQDTVDLDVGTLQCWSLHLNQGPLRARSPTSTGTARPTAPCSAPRPASGSSVAGAARCSACRATSP